MKKRFASLDAFRGLCALCVVIFHLHIVGSLTELAFFRGSAIFVEFFFVLSGFVLAHGYGFKKELHFIDFMRTRFYRLYPLHFFMFFVFLILEFLKLAAYHYANFSFTHTPFTESTAIKEIIPNLFLIHAWLPFYDAKSFNYASWSISIEFYLYILLFISMTVFSRVKNYIWIFTPLVAFYFILNSSTVFVSEVLRGLSCFFGGAFTYLIYKKYAHIHIPKITGTWLELSAIVCIVLLVQSEFPYKEIIASFLFFICVFIFSFESGIISHYLKFRPFQEAGKLSYSIYMTHSAILFLLTSSMLVLQKITGIEFAPMIEEIRYLTLKNDVLNHLLLLFILFLVLFISQLTYQYIELKWQQKGKRPLYQEKQLNQ